MELKDLYTYVDPDLVDKKIAHYNNLLSEFFSKEELKKYRHVIEDLSRYDFLLEKVTKEEQMERCK